MGKTKAIHLQDQSDGNVSLMVVIESETSPRLVISAGYHLTARFRPDPAGWRQLRDAIDLILRQQAGEGS